MVNITGSTFKNDVAELGGALYLTGGANINNTNITNNNATNGSAIYHNGGVLNLTKVILLENQAKANQFIETSYDVNGVSISGKFTGNDNVLNGIYRKAGTIKYTDVDYLGVGGIRNSGLDTLDASYSNREVYQTIYMEVYDRDNNLLYVEPTKTGPNGEYSFTMGVDEVPGWNAFKIYHPNDNYYTYTAYGIPSIRIVANLNVSLQNYTFTDTYNHKENITVKVTGSEDQPRRSVTVYLNTTLNGFANYTFTGDIDENGEISFTDADPLNYLNVSVYDVLVVYHGDTRYLPENITSSFTISKSQAPVTIDIENYTYNATNRILVNASHVLGEGIYSGTITVNVCSKELDRGRPLFNETYTVTLTNTDSGYTDFLPILDAGDYNITAYFSGTQNYESSVGYKNLTVYKAASIINVTGQNVTSLEDSIINVHVTPEVATSLINVTVTGSNGYEIFLENIELSDSRYTKNLGNLSEGNYYVLVEYNGDKNHNASWNITTFTVVNPEFGIDIDVSNMTYGENRTVTITVPREYIGTLTIKLNGTELTAENYTIEDGVITFNTAELPGIISDGKLVVGEYNISVNYVNGSGDKYESTNASILFSVFKAEPNIIVNTMNTTYGFNETITINLTSYNATGKVNITVYNESGNIFTNYSVDLNNDPILKQVLDYNTAIIGNFTVEVEYFDDLNYNNTIVSSNFQVVSPVITITSDRQMIFVEEFITLLGSVTDGYGRILTGGIVNVTVYDKEGNLHKSFNCSLNESGIYLGNKEYFESGTFTANATYFLNDVPVARSNSVEFNVTKIHTITNVTILNNTVYTVTIDVRVTENESVREYEWGSTDAKGNIITNGTIRVTFNRQSKDYELKGANTTIVLDVDPVDITTTLELPFTVEYLENWKYINSTGVNSTTGEKIETIAADPIGSNLTVTVSPNPSWIGKDVTISGHVFNDLQEEITSGKVRITVDGNDRGLVDITGTGYTTTYRTNKTGNIEVIVNYIGMKTGEYSEAKIIVFSSTNTTTFDVEKIPTVTNVTILNNTAGNVTLNISVTGIDENKTMQGVVNITIAENIIVPVNLDETEYIIVNLRDNITNNGNIGVRIVYTGNDYYIPSVGNNTADGTEFRNITVIKQNPLLTLNVDEPVVVNTSVVTISGRLYDDLGNNITGAYIVIHVDGKAFTILETNSTGEYSVEYPTNKVGEIVVNATYKGDNVRYNGVNASNTFEVIKYGTIHFKGVSGFLLCSFMLFMFMLKKFVIGVFFFSTTL